MYLQEAERTVPRRSAVFVIEENLPPPSYEIVMGLTSPPPSYSADMDSEKKASEPLYNAPDSDSNLWLYAKFGPTYFDL